MARGFGRTAWARAAAVRAAAALAAPSAATCRLRPIRAELPDDLPLRQLKEASWRTARAERLQQQDLERALALSLAERDRAASQDWTESSRSAIASTAVALAPVAVRMCEAAQHHSIADEDALECQVGGSEPLDSLSAWWHAEELSLQAQGRPGPVPRATRAFAGAAPSPGLELRPPGR
uniref:Uncharacterized protein n=1 Tax=Alexandrium catenella TaxID=2925 RepID=A0A7S1LTF3_ALECA